jgi:two-component system, sporulation sensor kinase E
MMRLEGEKLLNSILESTPHGIAALGAVRDPNGTVIDFKIKLINSEGEESLGFQPDEIEGKMITESFSERVSSDLLKLLIPALKRGKRFKKEMMFEVRDETLWFSFQGSQFGDGLTLSFIDISEDKSQSIQLLQSEAKYRKLFEESMDSIVLMNNEYLILEANNAMMELFGYQQDEIRFLLFSDLFVEEEAFWHFNKMLYKENRIEEFETELKLANGKTAVCLINLIQVVDNQNGLAQYQAVLKDITKRKKAESELILAEKLSMTGKIARSIAHEVRNPLTNLNLALEQLKDEVPEGVEDAELYFKIISRNAKRIEELIASLLESSKPKSLSLQNTDINKVIESSIKIVEDRLKLQQMNLKLNLANNLPELPIDIEQLKVAFINLMINAIEAMKAGEGLLNISSSLEHQEVKVIISDNGNGISKENIKKLFDPFFTAKKGGMGLGLTSVQNIVQSHLGDISVESEIGEGTRFILTFRI